MQPWCTEGGVVEEVGGLACGGRLIDRRADLQILTNPLLGLVRRGVSSEVADYI